MILHWLTTRVLGLAKGWWLLIVLAVLITAIIIARGWFDTTLETAVQAGAAEQREVDLRKTIRNVEKANDARYEVRNDIDGARYNQCLRTARTPANCERFLPARKADQR